MRAKSSFIISLELEFAPSLHTNISQTVQVPLRSAQAFSLHIRAERMGIEDKIDSPGEKRRGLGLPQGWLKAFAVYPKVWERIRLTPEYMDARDVLIRVVQATIPQFALHT